MKNPIAGLLSFAHLGSAKAPKPPKPSAKNKADDDEAAKKKADTDDDEDQNDDSDEKPDDDEDQDGVDDGEARGRTAERQRCAAIFASPEAAGRVEMAATLAFTTDMTAAQAVAVLASSPRANAGASSYLAKAMETAPKPNIGTDGAGASGNGGNTHADLAQSMLTHARSAGIVPAKR